MSVWQEPKTDWVASDFLTPDAWNRIIGNLDYLYTTLKMMGFDALDDVTMTSTGLTKTYNSLVYPRDLNAIENDLHNINNATFQFDIGTKMTFSSYGKAPTYQEINRIERGIQMLYAPTKSVSPFCLNDAITASPGDFGLL